MINIIIIISKLFSVLLFFFSLTVCFSTMCSFNLIKAFRKIATAISEFGPNEQRVRDTKKEVRFTLVM